MSDAQILLWAVPGFPLAAAIIISLLGPRFLKQHRHVPAIIAFAASCAAALLILGGLLAIDTEPILRADAGTWFSSNLLPGRTALPPTGLSASFTLQVDALSAVMLAAITFVGTWIAIFSAGYMKGDPGYPRFFAVTSLFLFSMTGLVLADNFLLL